MKINFLSNPFKTYSSVFALLVALIWTFDLNAQCPGKSPTCRFVGTTPTNDTIKPNLIIGLNPGSCMATVNVPVPALNTPGCAFAADRTSGNVSGPAIIRSSAGCTFADGCNIKTERYFRVANELPVFALFAIVILVVVKPF